MNQCAIPGLNLCIPPDRLPAPALPAEPDSGVAVLAGGCFWCTEAVFAQLDGVRSVEPGYAGGHALRANYEAVCSGVTGHAEAIRIGYDPARIGFGTLLRVFFAVAHDATQHNRQGNDIGTQYRSAIFTHHAAQSLSAQSMKNWVEQAIEQRVTTQIEPYNPAQYTRAEEYHQEYFERNPDNGYCQMVIPNKLSKLRANFAQLLK